MTADNLPPFHLAIPVHDLADARAFYGDLLGCPEGRSSESWVDFNFFGHQLVCHLHEDYSKRRAVETSNLVDDHDVPVPHFGAVLDLKTWDRLSQKLKAANIRFVVEPHIRFKGQSGEQATMFLLDPSGNAIEFKAFQDIAGQLLRSDSMQYQMKQKLLSWGDDFIIRNAQGEDSFFVDSKVFSLGDQLSFQDMARNELSFIKQKVLSWCRLSRFTGRD